MKLLLDTHVFLWFVSGDTRISTKAKSAIADANNEVAVSVISLWEVIIKYNLGKLPLPRPPGLYFTEQRTRHRIESLPVDEHGAAELAHLPQLHRDPFDRMLIAQAISRSMMIVSDDAQVLQYPVPRL